MKTNVKPGDIAMVKAPYAEPGRGAIVEVIRTAKTQERLGDCLYCSHSGQGWVVRGWLRDVRGRMAGPLLVIDDDCLRPIRPDDGEDEVLRLTGKPNSTEDLAVCISTLREEFDEAALREIVWKRP